MNEDNKLSFQNSTSIEEANFTPARKTVQYIAALSASVAALSLGTTLAWTSQISVKLLNGTEYGFSVTEDQLGWVGSLVSLGAAFLSLFTGSICDYFGRKNTMLLLIIVSTTGWANLIWAKNVAMLYIGRFLTGMAGGAYCVAVPTYTSEIAQKEIRGSLGCFLQLQISFGIFLATLVGKYTSIQMFTVMCALVPIIFGAIFVFMPETPIYLLKKGKMTEAVASLKRLRGENYDFHFELKEIQVSVDDKAEGNIFKVFWESVKETGPRKACIVGVGLMFFKVLCAIDAITSFMAYILEMSGMTLNPMTGAIIFGAIQTIFSVIQSSIVDKLGRRFLLLLSQALMALCLFAVAFSLFLRQRNIIPPGEYLFVNYLPLISLCVFTVAFSMGLGPIPFMMCSEIFSEDIKSLMCSFCSFLCWFLAFAVIKVFLVLKLAWGADVAFCIFAVLSAGGVVFIALLVPETKGKSFKQIQMELSGTAN